VATFVFVCALLFGMTAAGSTTRPPLPINLHGPWTTRAIGNYIEVAVCSRGVADAVSAIRISA
jgi:hypothetical protein